MDKKYRCDYCAASCVKYDWYSINDIYSNIKYYCNTSCMRDSLRAATFIRSFMSAE